MDALLEKLNAGQIIALVSILVGGIVAVTMIVAITKYSFQALADETALKREKQQADMALRAKLIQAREASGDKASVAELLALGSSRPEPDELNAELAKRFGQLDADAGDIERALQRALATDAEHKRMIVAVMDDLLENGASYEAILAAVRPLCAATPLSPKEPASSGA
jgi:hypothetical protein